MDPYPCDPAGLVQCPNSWIPPKSIGEGASSLFGGWPESLENVSCSSATPDLHRCNLGVAPEQETFWRLSGPSPKRLLAPSPIDSGGMQEFGHFTSPTGSQPYPQPQNSLVRISVCIANQVSHGNPCEGEPGRGKSCSRCSFQNFRSLTKGSQVSLVRIHFSHNQNQMENRQTLGVGVESGS